MVRTGKKGFVTLVGAGPGDPDLLTIKGKKAIAQAEVLIYDRLASEKLLDYTPAGCERIYVGKRSGYHSMKQEEINDVIVKKALEQKNVVRLKGGDSFVFGRGGEEISAIEKEGIPYKLIPGVTSAIAVPECAGIPVTHRGTSQSFHVITGHTASSGSTLTENYDVLARLEGTLVFLMGLSNLPAITKGLMENGKSRTTKAAVIENGTMPGQRRVTGTLETIETLVKEAEIGSPSIIVVGETAGFSMCCKEMMPLTNVKIGVTGTKHIVKKLSKKLRSYNALVTELNFMKIECLERGELASAFSRIKEYQWVVFTSSNAIRIFFEQIKEMHLDIRLFSHLKYAVIGTGTRDTLVQYGIYADYMPEIFTTEELAKGLSSFAGAQEKLLIPRAKRGSCILNQILDEKGMHYDDLKIYDVLPDEKAYRDAMDKSKDLDYITFESSSGVENFFASPVAFTNVKSAKLVCIGDVTAKALHQFGITDCLVSKEFTMDGIIETILADRKDESYV